MENTIAGTAFICAHLLAQRQRVESAAGQLTPVKHAHTQKFCTPLEGERCSQKILFLASCVDISNPLLENAG